MSSKVDRSTTAIPLDERNPISRIQTRQARSARPARPAICRHAPAVIHHTIASDTFQGKRRRWPLRSENSPDSTTLRARPLMTGIRQRLHRGWRPFEDGQLTAPFSQPATSASISRCVASAHAPIPGISITSAVRATRGPPRSAGCGYRLSRNFPPAAPHRRTDRRPPRRPIRSARQERRLSRTAAHIVPSVRDRSLGAVRRVAEGVGDLHAAHPEVMPASLRAPCRRAESRRSPRAPISADPARHPKPYGVAAQAMSHPAPLLPCPRRSPYPLQDVQPGAYLPTARRSRPAFGSRGMGIYRST